MKSNLFFCKAEKHEYWKDVENNDWLDWKWQLANVVSTPEILQKILNISNQEKRDIKIALKKLRMAITPYFLSQIDTKDPNCPIRLQSIPSLLETHISDSDFSDPLHEEEDCPDKELKGVLTHRYPDRLIIYVTYQCAMYCRHCTRRRCAGETDIPTPMKLIKKAAEYVKQNKSVRDVLISGGDPLTLPDDYLESILKLFREIRHLEILRIGTRVPVVLPMRITENLCKMLKKYHPLWINLHFNHPREMTDLTSKACNMLADSGIPLGSQSVLLNGINNNPQIFKKLVKLLVANRVRPYYIYQCDLSEGIEHFRTRVAEGIEIIEALRGHTTGFAVPTFVVDGIGGGGKVPVMPNYAISQNENKWVFRNYEGMIFNYTEPKNYIKKTPSQLRRFTDKSDKTNLLGVEKLLANSKENFIIPKNSKRLSKNR